ncbi:iron-containing redox enzyme family protein [Microbulbifer rhizosphaerae]|uniref:Iron-containing redox enzyme n=1 Tax=Microbulbifer rhizosphaerae TaxID=1562603 RepID=A0A7W4WBG5_9GAMM|nr:iron-containing redox enzyme family protein [Microbulbifer rhizosphaerae]MBB3060607.1 hypothetical protein [Microbulbifer rhizosphaerae]
MKTINLSVDITQSTELLKTCAEQLGSSLPTEFAEILIRWRQQTFTAPSPFLKELLATNPIQWDKSIAAHRAHSHPWYDFISSTIDIDNMASFLLENKYYPTFIALLEKILDIQFTDDAVSAVQENIDDEFEPEPHANLMRKMMMAVKKRAAEPIRLDDYPALNDRTLIFYYGYYLEPWHLVGSLFATEQMGTHRVICMKTGLERMGLSADELEFTTVHSECDEHHADDWLQRVIMPSIEARPELLNRIAAGIAECLDTSALYLDYVHERAQLRIAG